MERMGRQAWKGGLGQPEGVCGTWAGSGGSVGTQSTGKVNIQLSWG